MSLMELQLALQEAIKQALNEPHNIADVEIHNLVMDDDAIRVKGHYSIRSFLSEIAAGNFKIKLNKKLQILELDLTE